MIDNIEEKIIHPRDGIGTLIVTVLFFPISIVLMIYGSILVNEFYFGTYIIFVGVFLFFLQWFIYPGLKLVKPNEAVVLTLFGKYYGTIKKEGYYFVNPFCGSGGRIVTKSLANGTITYTNVGKRLSLKAMTLKNEKQKVNDQEGNPIEIGVVVIWRVVDTAKAIFSVDDFSDFISTQADASIRNVARKYPYDLNEADDEKSLRSSANEISIELMRDLQEKVLLAGIEVIDARIAHLAYAPEIAAVMLQRQQAKAIIDARQKIVDGAVGMVEMALNKLNENKIVELTGNQKAQLVSNLLVVLCGSKDAAPIVNTGSI